MSGRYLITVVQLRVIQSGIKDDSFADDANGVIENILDSQFVGNSNQSITDDVTGVCLHIDKQK